MTDSVDSAKSGEAFDSDRIRSAVHEILVSIGENPEREGLLDTPNRVVEWYRDIFSGLQSDPEEVLSVFFEENHTEPVAFTDISFNSICEHHLLPFYGYAHVAYVPKGRLIGASKVSRLIDVLAKRPQIQERLTTQIADSVYRYLDASASYVFMSAKHTSMTLRGVKKTDSKIVTSAQRGGRQEVKQLIKTIRLSKS
jgi:GTP cyclohydrolase I